MALVKFGAGIVDMRGSIGGTVFSRNKSGAIARARTKPVDPGSVFQTAIRSVIAQLVVRWKDTVTAAQRTVWNQYAAAVPMVNRLGETINLTGFNHFIRSNSARQQCGLAVVDDGPTVLSLPGQDPTLTLTASEASNELSIAFDDTMDWLDEAGAGLIMLGSPEQRPTINFYKAPFRLADSVDGDDTTPPTSPTSIASPFTLHADNKVFVQARISRADGRLSEPFRVFCLISA